MTKTCVKCGEVQGIEEFRERRNKCKKCESEYTKVWCEKNKEKKATYLEEYRSRPKTIELRKTNRHEWYVKNKQLELDRTREWMENNKERHLEVKRNWDKMKRDTDPMYRLNNAFRKRICESVRDKNNNHWEEIIGYKIQTLKQHLETQFEDGMTWNNYGEWHIDHKIPVSLWKYESYKDKEFKQCWALANLQPLWAIDNLKKHNNME